MVNVFLGVICAIILFVTLETIKYNKERNERNNNRDTKFIPKARVQIRNNSKISKSKVQDKGKPVSPKKKTNKSKVKRNARQNKKKV